MKQVFLRTCQECLFQLFSDSGPLAGDKIKDSYLFKKCPRCKSESLDYGSYQNIAESPEEQLELDFNG